MDGGAKTTAATAADSPTPTQEVAESRLARIIESPEAMVFGFLVIVCVVLAIAEPLFLKSENLLNVLRQSSVLAVFSVGLMFVVLGGGVDISLGSMMAAVAIVNAKFAMSTNVPEAIILAIVFGGLFGLLNGFLVTVVRLSPIIVTIATGQVFLGWALLQTSTGSIRPDVPGFATIGTFDIGPIPGLAVIAAVTMVLGHLILTRTRYGRYVYAFGGNRTAAALAGVAVRRVELLTYVIAGIFVGIAAVLLTSRIGSADASTGSTTMFAAYAAVFIGGTAWTGGVGTMVGTALGVLLLGVLNNGMNLLQLASPYQTIVLGGVIILAVTTHNFRKRAR